MHVSTVTLFILAMLLVSALNSAVKAALVRMFSHAI
jgi:hypothetical protein